MTTEQSKQATWVVAIFVAVLCVYFPAYSGQFIWDDIEYVEQNPNLLTPGGLWKSWSDLSANQQFYPMVFTTFWLENQIWGKNPIGYHVVNAVLHAANAVLLALLLRRLAAPAPWLAAVIFALHPICVESVAWISERKNVLSMFFYLLAAISYLKFAGIDSIVADKTVEPSDDSHSRNVSLNWRWYFVSFGLFLLALLSKTVTASLPATLLLLLWFQERLSWKHALQLAPFFVAGIFMGLLTAYVEREHVGAVGREFQQTFDQRTIIAGRAIWFYLGKILLPIRLMFIYPRWNEAELAGWQHLFPITALAVLAILFGLRRKLGRGPLVAALFFGGTLFPALGFMNVYPMRFSFVADHFQYVACCGPIAVIAALLARWQQWPWSALTRQPAKVNVAHRWTVQMLLPISLLGLLAGLSCLQTFQYANAETIWRTTIAKNPGAFMAHNNLGQLLAVRGANGEALEHIRAATELNPYDFKNQYNLGLILRAFGRLPEAAQHLEKSVELYPRFADSQSSYGSVLIDLGKRSQARAALDAALALEPRHSEAWTNLGVLYAVDRDYAKALECFERALEINPDQKTAKINLQRVRSLQQDQPPH